MPNYCFNILYLNEDSNDSILEVVKDYLSPEGNLDFDKIRPTPDELLGWSGSRKDNDPSVARPLIHKYGFDNWYDWRLANWGSRSGSYGIVNSDASFISFETAWAPPLRIIDTLANLTKRDFRLVYIEEGEDYCGEYFTYADQIKPGIDAEYSPISTAPEELRKELAWTADEEEEEVANQ